MTNHTSALTISGSGENGAGVTIFVHADNGGRHWSVDRGQTCALVTCGVFSTDISLSGDGVHHVRAIQTDIAGNPSTSSAALDITIDTTAPAAPTALDLDAEIGRASCRERV